MPTSSLGDMSMQVGSTAATADAAFSTTTYVAGGATNTAIAQGSLPTTWTKYTATYTVPTNTNNICVDIGFTGEVNAGTADWYEISQVQIEIGSTATPFEQRLFGAELALCQRYYEVITALLFTAGWAADAHDMSWTQAKRVAPTLSWTLSGGSGGTYVNLSLSSFYQSGANSIAGSASVNGDAEL
tara:strand:+ start:77 stop:634 length:558 start_codon:yes stop_codon:yes gene_type:complete